ncbi:MAG TPA: immunoglobulin domain-containing protein, partial [Verrucomicrobiae bacterium]|nr:immunoglobulin domain-containing protein [Verrucomicrobiae bacterium]
AAEGAPGFVPNIATPLYVGLRSDNTHYFAGTMSDIAFYNYALSPAQISNHWSSAYQAAQIAQQPVGVTNVEGSTITLSPVIQGLPNKYQWYKDNVPLAASLNADQTPHYPQDVTNMTLTISQATPSDSGQYKVVVTNPLGGATSTPVAVLVTPDQTLPVVTSVTALGTPNRGGPTPFLVKVTFNKRIDPLSGSAPASYSIDGGVTISGNPSVAADVQTANFGGDWKTVFLPTSGLTPGQKYNLTVNGVKDQAQTPHTVTSSVTQFTAPTLTPGVVDWDYYYIGGSVSTSAGVTPLTGDTAYIGYGPDTNSYLTVFDSHQITGGDLHNNADFGALGDNYGASLSGWVTPTQSGDYTFFLASDDASELWLSPDANPLNAVLVAQETACCHGFQEPGAPTTSSPQTLVAGHSYFLQALQIEGGGGDYVEVAWRISTDTTASTNLVPISAQFLSAYASQAPTPPKFSQPVLSNGQVTLNWTGTATLQESTDLKNWTPVTGNPTSPFVINPTGAPIKFYRLVP